MPLGSFRLNSLAKFEAPSANLGARSAAATFSASAGPSYSTTARFGTNSIETTSTTSRTYNITVNPANTNWYLNTSNVWTIEFFSNALSKGSEGIRTIFSTNNSLGQSGLNFSDTVANGTYQFDFRNDGTRLSDAHLSNGLPNENQWYHWAIVSLGNGTVRLYSNGTQRFSGDASLSGTNRTIAFGHASFVNPQTSNFAFDEIRISNNARYTANFTAPSTAFTNDANTLALFHFNGTSTDDVS